MRVSPSIRTEPHVNAFPVLEDPHAVVTECRSATELAAVRRGIPNMGTHPGDGVNAVT
jgi:hypothetical protein